MDKYVLNSTFDHHKREKSVYLWFSNGQPTNEWHSSRSIRTILLIYGWTLNRNNHWHNLYYFDYHILRKKWMYILLNALKKALAGEPEALRLIDEVFQKMAFSGLIVRAKKEKVRKTDIVGYLIKYVASPPIALYRITGYDGEYVQYWYREHPTDRQVFTKVSAYEFIARLIQHIPSKGQKLIRHYGLYARVKFKKVKEIIVYNYLIQKEKFI